MSPRRLLALVVPQAELLFCICLDPRSSFWAEPMHKCSSGFKALTWLLRASYLAVMLLAWYLALMLSRRKPLTGAVPIILSPPWVWSTIRRASNPSDIHTEATWSNQKLLLYNFAFFAQNLSVKKVCKIVSFASTNSSFEKQQALIVEKKWAFQCCWAMIKQEQATKMST